MTFRTQGESEQWNLLLCVLQAFAEHTVSNYSPKWLTLNRTYFEICQFSEFHKASRVVYCFKLLLVLMLLRSLLHLVFYYNKLFEYISVLHLPQKTWKFYYTFALYFFFILLFSDVPTILKTEIAFAGMWCWLVEFPLEC